MSEKLLLSENSRTSRVRMRDASAKPAKTKIVVHLNNYILPNDDTDRNFRSIATPESSIDFYETDFPPTDYRFNELNANKNKNRNKENEKEEYMILKAKSLNFPIKIRSSYAIYQSSNLADSEKKTSINRDYKIIENKISNIVNYEMYKRLPIINSSQNDPNYHTLRQMFLKDRVSNPNSLPNYLKPNYNLQPSYSIVNKTKLDPKLSPIFSYKKMISERNNNLVERFNKIDHILKKRQQKSDASSSTAKTSVDDGAKAPKNSIIKQIETKPSEIIEEMSKKDSTSLKKITIVEPTNKIFSFVTREIPQKTVNVDNNSTKLPYIMRSFDPNEFAISLTTHSVDYNQSYDNFNEHSQLSSLTDEVDDRINKILKNYPSIVIRRQGNRKFPKLKNYINENHIKYEIANFKTNTTTTTNANISKEAPVSIIKATTTTDTKKTA